MPAIIVYLAIRLGLILKDPRKSLRQVLRSRPRHVWALWLVGVVVVLGFCEFDPGLIVYLAEPELLAGIVLLMAFQLRRSLQTAWHLTEAVIRRSLFRWEQARTGTSIGVRLYATTLVERVAISR